MTIYNLEFHEAALKEWRKLDGSIKRQFKDKLAERLLCPRVPKAQLHGNDMQDTYKIKLRNVGYNTRSVQCGHHGVRIAKVTRVDHQIVAALGRWRRIQGFNIVRCDMLQVQRAVVFHGDGKDEYRTAGFFQESGHLVGNGRIANIGPTAIGIAERTNINELIKTRPQRHGKD